MIREAKRKWAQALYVLYAGREIAKRGPKGPRQPHVDAPGAGLAVGLPHKARTFALGRIYQVLAVHFENTEFYKTYVLLEDDNHSLQRVPSNEVTVNRIE